MLSVFKSTFDVNNPYDIELHTVLELFKRDKYGLQAKRNTDEISEFKRGLPVVTFGGTFSKRNNESLIQASGLMILDFDNTPMGFEKILDNDIYIFSYFKSTSGTGYKALVKIPLVKNDLQYKAYFKAIQKRFPELDPSGKDISRCCYWTYDPNLVIKDSVIWTNRIKEKRKRIKPIRIRENASFDKVINKIRMAVKGSRNVEIYNASMLAGGYVQAGLIHESEALGILKREADMVAPDETNQNEKTIINGFKNGLNKPFKIKKR